LLGNLLLQVIIAVLANGHHFYLLSAMKVASATYTKALRNGEFRRVLSSDLVKGDVIRIRQGDIIPADVKLLHGDPIQVDQSLLTGETLPLFKYSGDEAYAGTLCARGEIEALVYATGKDTFGASQHGTVRPQVKRESLDSSLILIGPGMLYGLIAWCVLEFVIQFGVRPGNFRFANVPPIGTQFLDVWNLFGADVCVPGVNGCPTLVNVLVLLIVGIPISVTFSGVTSLIISIGASKLLAKGVVVGRFSAIEKLATMDVLCVDQTGILTGNELTIDRSQIYVSTGYTEKDVIFYAALSARTEDGEPVDVCTVNSLDEDQLNELADYKVLTYYPHDPETQRTMVELEDTVGTVLRVVKAPPGSILSICGLTEQAEGVIEDKIAELAKRGHRAVAVAKSYSTKDFVDGALRWELIGVIPFCDPPRIESPENVKALRDLGVKIKLFSEDQLLMAIENARLVGLSTDVHAARCLDNPAELCDLITLDHFVEMSDGFAEATDAHKFQIVRRLTRLKYTVGCTGETATAVPALEEASIGITTSRSSDAAKMVSDVFLLEPGLSGLISGVLSSGKTFHILKTFILFVISNYIRLTFTFGLLTVGWDWYFSPVLAAIIVILNLLFCLVLPFDQLHHQGVAARWNLRKLVLEAAITGICLTGSSLLLFDLLSNHQEVFAYAGALALPLHTYEGEARLRSIIFMHAAISGQLNMFLLRATSSSFLQRPSISLVITFVLVQLAAMLIGVYGLNGYPQLDFTLPPGDLLWTRESVLGCGWGYALAVWIWSVMWYLFMDVSKLFITRYYDKATAPRFSQ